MVVKNLFYNLNNLVSSSGVSLTNFKFNFFDHEGVEYKEFSLPNYTGFKNNGLKLFDIKGDTYLFNGLHMHTFDQNTGELKKIHVPAIDNYFYGGNKAKNYCGINYLHQADKWFLTTNYCLDSKIYQRDFITRIIDVQPVSKIHKVDIHDFKQLGEDMVVIVKEEDDDEGVVYKFIPEKKDLKLELTLKSGENIFNSSLVVEWSMVNASILDDKKHIFVDDNMSNGRTYEINKIFSEYEDGMEIGELKYKVVNPYWVEAGISVKEFEELDFHIDTSLPSFRILTNLNLKKWHIGDSYQVSISKENQIYEKFRGHVYHHDKILDLYMIDDLFTQEDWTTVTSMYPDIENSYDFLTVRPLLDVQGKVIFYDKKFYLFHRLNPQKMTRWVQYSTSENLRDWESFEPIYTTPEFNPAIDCFYTPNIFQYPGTEDFCGFIPTFDLTTKEFQIQLLMGETPTNFNRFLVTSYKNKEEEKDIKEEEEKETKVQSTEVSTSVSATKPNDPLHSNQLLTVYDGIIHQGDKTHIYYYNYEENDTLKRVSIGRDRLVGIKFNDGNAVMSPFFIDNDRKLYINYKSDDELLLTFFTVEKKPLGGLTLTGDSINAELDISTIVPEDCKCVVMIFEGTGVIYSISGGRFIKLPKEGFSKVSFSLMDFYNRSSSEAMSIDIEQDGQKGIEIVGNPIYEEGGSKVSVDIKYKDDVVRRVVLVDKSDESPPEFFELNNPFINILMNAAPEIKELLEMLRKVYFKCDDDEKRDKVMKEGKEIIDDMIDNKFDFNINNIFQEYITVNNYAKKEFPNTPVRIYNIHLV